MSTTTGAYDRLSDADAVAGTDRRRTSPSRSLGPTDWRSMVQMPSFFGLDRQLLNTTSGTGYPAARGARTVVRHGHFTATFDYISTANDYITGRRRFNNRRHSTGAAVAIWGSHARDSIRLPICVHPTFLNDNPNCMTVILPNVVPTL
jgi:hypothetical protein